VSRELGSNRRAQGTKTGQEWSLTINGWHNGGGCGNGNGDDGGGNTRSKAMKKDAHVW
jgi:hypothetical protein